jgi:signal transduction histidine kinase
LKLELVRAPVSIKREHLNALVGESLDNAFKFSPQGSAVLVKLESVGESASLRISDKGRGMSKQQIAQIGAFSQFGRETHEQQGSGLGLALIKLISELYGGSLSIDSAPNSGTTLRILLLSELSRSDVNDSSSENFPQPGNPIRIT